MADTATNSTRLSALNFPPIFTTSTSDLIVQFYIPAMQRSITYDRGVGFFSSSWLRLAADGIVALAENGGKARFVASPILQAADWEALKRGTQAQEDPTLYEALRRSLLELRRDLSNNQLSAISWMVADELLQFRIALPTAELDGDFHDKFGIFQDSVGNEIAFHGSPNDSQQAFRNYESIDVFCSWLDGREAERVRNHRQRFDRIWNNEEPNLRTFPLPEAIRHELAELRQENSRPYGKPKQDETNRRWRHQIEAQDRFMSAGGRGVLDMATGTGKTRTSLNIAKKLIQNGAVDTVIIAADGNDLLDQWYVEILGLTRELPRRFGVVRNYGSYHERDYFVNDPTLLFLLASRPTLAPALRALNSGNGTRTLLIHDEVHKLGSPGNQQSLGRLSDHVRFRLGLSATPDREYDSGGNVFIENHIGPVVFVFGLEEAIKRGILSPFSYWPIRYIPTDEDRDRLRQVWARAAASEASGQPMSKEEIWIELAKVYKTSPAKLPLFSNFIRQHPDLLERCIIFVETEDYGYQVLQIVHEIRPDFHTYFAQEDSETLARFARGEIQCLLTCHRLSEGIDIRTLKTVILFSSARAKLETIQRIGRCLRIDPADPIIRANVVDFVRAPDPLAGGNPDDERHDWLTALSQVSPEQE
jgi:superfamily II DNA or RNA helicase